MGTNWWASEVGTLRRMAGEPLDTVCAALPRHERKHISVAFQRFGIKRQRVVGVAGELPPLGSPVLEQLRAVRLALGVSQGELSSRIGADRSYLSRVERGECMPGVARTERIARELGMKLVLVADED